MGRWITIAGHHVFIKDSEDAAPSQNTPDAEGPNRGQTLASNPNPGYTSAEQKALMEYRGPGFGKFNRALRGSEALNAAQLKRTELLDRAMQKNTLNQDAVLYRGTAPIVVRTGDVVTEKAYISTSARGVPHDYAFMGQQWEISVPKGQNAVIWNAFAKDQMDSSYDEVTLPRNLRLKIDSVDHQKRGWDTGGGNRHDYFVEVVKASVVR